jgi:hypothetical protein
MPFGSTASYAADAVVVGDGAAGGKRGCHRGVPAAFVEGRADREGVGAEHQGDVETGTLEVAV